MTSSWKSYALAIPAFALIACAAPTSEDGGAESATGAQTVAEPHQCVRVSRLGDDYEDDHHVSRGTKYEDNDTLEHAKEIDPVDDSEIALNWRGTRGISGKKDVDWFRFHATDSNSSSSKFLKPAVRIRGAEGANFRLCAFSAQRVQCEIGTAEKQGAMFGCCASDGGGVRLDVENPFLDDTRDIFVRVQGLGDCLPYTLEHTGAFLLD